LGLRDKTHPLQWNSNYQLTGQVRLGEPGVVSWTVYRLSGLLPDDHVLSDFQASATARTAVDLGVHDEARSASARYLIGRASLRPLPTFDAPRRAPDLLDHDPATGGALDLEAVWVDFDASWVNLTSRVATLDPQALAKCPKDAVRYDFGLSAGGEGPEDGTRFGWSDHLRVRFNQTQLIHWGYYAGHGPISGGVFMSLRGERFGSAIEGSPGFVRLSYERAAWTGPTDWRALDVDVDVRCNISRPAADTISFHGVFDVPAAGWSMGVLCASAAFLRLRRRNLR
jgi:hypothetical protein